MTNFLIEAFAVFAIALAATARFAAARPIAISRRVSGNGMGARERVRGRTRL